jgi:maltooligosyltrehalose trehalohydrolase
MGQCALGDGVRHRGNGPVQPVSPRQSSVALPWDVTSFSPVSQAWRRFPIGVELGRDGVAHARVWAPSRQRVELVSGPGGNRVAVLDREDDGYFSGPAPGLGAGDRYWLRLGGEEKLYPDPASRHQPDGPHGPSVVVDPGAFQWSDGDWRGVGRDGQVVYELHIGTFTQEGTYASAARELPRLRALGVTVLELMPLAEFPGRFGWGYDGVGLWAPSHLYGSPDDLRRLIDAAHREGLGVILDVVYNHLGPDGNYLTCFSPHYFTKKYENEWGESLNFDGEGAGPVRELYIENAGYWIEELHFDGLRLDATQSIHDDGSYGEHLLAAITRRVRAAARERATLIVAENEPQETRLVRPLAEGGYGMDGLWNDDFHHSAVVALTGHNQAYLSDHLGTPQELISGLKWGYLFQGQWYRWQKRPRGNSARGLGASNFVAYLENHDQVANSGGGLRLTSLAAPGRLRAMTALLLLGPGTPMLFQGQEFLSTRPFLYFADHAGDLGAAVARGRREFLRQFPALASADAQARVPDPAAEETFLACKLDAREAAANLGSQAMYRDLLSLRGSEAAFRRPDADRMHGAVLGPEALALRFLGDEPADDRLMLVNLGRDLSLSPIPEPLLAPPSASGWRLLWSSEAVAYGGDGIPAEAAICDARWMVPGGAAVVFAAQESS